MKTSILIAVALAGILCVVGGAFAQTNWECIDYTTYCDSLTCATVTVGACPPTGGGLTPLYNRITQGPSTIMGTASLRQAHSALPPFIRAHWITPLINSQ